MFSGHHKTIRSTHNAVAILALVVLVSHGCAHPWNGKGTTTPLSVLQSQAVQSSDRQQVTADGKANQAASDITVEVTPSSPAVKPGFKPSMGNPADFKPAISQPAAFQPAMPQSAVPMPATAQSTAYLPDVSGSAFPVPQAQQSGFASSNATPLVTHLIGSHPVHPRPARQSKQLYVRDASAGKASGWGPATENCPAGCRPVIAISRSAMPQIIANANHRVQAGSMNQMPMSSSGLAVPSVHAELAKPASNPAPQYPPLSQKMVLSGSRPSLNANAVAPAAGRANAANAAPRVAPVVVTAANAGQSAGQKSDYVTAAKFEEIESTGAPKEATSSEIQAQVEAEAVRLKQAAQTPAPAAEPAPPVPNPPGNAPAPFTGPIQIPLDGVEPPKDIELSMKNGRVTLVTRNAPVQAVLNMLAEQQGLNLISTDDVRDTISVTLTNVAFEDALNSIVAVAGCTWTQNRGIVLVSKMGGDSRGTPDLQGKIVQVLPLNFVAAADVEAMVKGLLSPLGQVFTSHTQVGDKRRTQELVIVEDIPTSVSRITQYIQQIDQPPRQVMIEAHVLQVDLTDNMQHGVDWKFLTTYMGRNVGLNTAGFTNAATSPTSIFSFDGDHLDLVVQALKTTTDAKTLASPKVIVANGQEARIQIGSKLGYFVTTTTQTSTLQNVNFLNTGVLLRVTPQISNDGRVLMAVRPEVSTGSISAAGLPQTNTTEAETTVLMDDNGGMIIGGLIKEADSDTQNKVPLLGDLWLIGRLFQQRSTARTRSEIIIVLIPRIAPYLPDVRAAELANIQRTVTPLFQNGLQPAPRPGDPRLPDAIKNPRRLIPSRLPDLFANPQRNNPRPLNYYFPTEDEEFNPVEPLFLDLPVFDDRPFEVSPPPETLSGPPPVTLPAIEPTRPAALFPDLNSARSGAVPPPPAPAF